MIDIVNHLGKKQSKRLICEVLEFNRSTVYDRKKRIPKKGNKKLEAAIVKIALENQAYGYKRVAEVAKRKKLKVGKKLVRKIMKENGLLQKKKQKWISTTDSNHSNRVYPNLAPKIKVTGLNQLWVGDVTYVPISKGKFVYVATLIDVYSRKVVGYDVSMNIDTQLCLNTFNMALETRKGDDLSGLVHHTDRGVQYTSKEYVKTLADQGIIGSMSRKGNPYDNAFAETFFKTLKYEWLYRHELETFLDVFSLVKDFIQSYNSERLHSSIGYRPPNEFEQFCVSKQRDKNIPTKRRNDVDIVIENVL